LHSTLRCEGRRPVDSSPKTRSAEAPLSARPARRVEAGRRTELQCRDDADGQQNGRGVTKPGLDADDGNRGECGEVAGGRAAYCDDVPAVEDFPFATIAKCGEP